MGPCYSFPGMMKKVLVVYILNMSSDRAFYVKNRIFCLSAYFLGGPSDSTGSDRIIPHLRDQFKNVEKISLIDSGN